MEFAVAVDDDVRGGRVCVPFSSSTATADQQRSRGTVRWATRAVRRPVPWPA